MIAAGIFIIIFGGVGYLSTEVQAKAGVKMVVRRRLEMRKIALGIAAMGAVTVVFGIWVLLMDQFL